MNIRVKVTLSINRNFTRRTIILNMTDIHIYILLHSFVFTQKKTSAKQAVKMWFRQTVFNFQAIKNVPRNSLFHFR